MSLEEQLAALVAELRMGGKGGLSAGLVVTRHARDQGLPLDPRKLLTEGEGQVLGLGKGAVQAILEQHGITRVLAEEGGRTSRRTPRMMRAYVEFLNDVRPDLDTVEAWWVARVRDFFASKPFGLKHDPSKSLRSMIRDLLQQAEKRQRENPGTMYAGSVLQHLVGAKLELLLPGEVEHHGASVADEPSGRDADFRIGDVAIHVTMAPGEHLIRKCGENLSGWLRPLIVTTGKGVLVADGLADQQGIGGRVDVFEAEQFLAGNVYELGRFDADARRATVVQLIDKYNEIVSKHETDPSLSIEVG